MKPVVTESISELIALVGSAIGTAVFTIGGMLTEHAALQNVLTGHIVLGAWEAWMGTLALIVGLYLLGYREFWPRLQQLHRYPNGWDADPRE